MNKEIYYKKLKKLGVGSASDVYLLDENQVIVVGKREDCFSNYQSLYEKSKFIDGKIKTIRYPKISKIITPNDEFIYGAMIEDYMHGKELRSVDSKLSYREKEIIGEKLSAFLNELHAINFNGNKEEEIKINLQKFDRSINLLKNYLPNEVIEKLLNVREKYFDLMKSKEFYITHGDLNAGNILIADNHDLSGIIDFGNMEFYIPEVEFAHMYFFDKTIYDHMIKHYTKKIKDEDVVLVEMVMNIRHFKNIVKFEDKVEHCLQNIKGLVDKYFSCNEK